MKSTTHSGRRTGDPFRIGWVIAAVLFLCLAALALFRIVRTPADAPPEVSPDPVSVRRLILPCRSAAVPTGGDPFADRLTERFTDTTAPHPETAPPSVDPAPKTVFRHGPRDGEKRIALTFDDGPHPRYTPEILDILSEYDIPATFFMIGENIRYYPETARLVVDAGHEIGNHTYAHERLRDLPPDEIRRAVSDCETALGTVSDRPMRYLRPPEGSIGPALRSFADGSDYRLVLWSIDTRDWAHTPADEIVRHILKEVQSGDVILMHDFIGHDSPTPDALRAVIPALLEKGYRFVPLCELMEPDS